MSSPTHVLTYILAFFLTHFLSCGCLAKIPRPPPLPCRYNKDSFVAWVNNTKDWQAAMHAPGLRWDDSWDYDPDGALQVGSVRCVMERRTTTQVQMESNLDFVLWTR